MQAQNQKKDPTLDNFGPRLRKARKAKGLSQAALAATLGYKHNGPISTLEKNKTNPDLETLRGLANALDIDLHWLITGKARVQGLTIPTQLLPHLPAFLQELNTELLRMNNTIVRLEMAQRFKGEDHEKELAQHITLRDGLKAEYDKLLAALKNQPPCGASHP